MGKKSSILNLYQIEQNFLESTENLVLELIFRHEIDPSKHFLVYVIEYLVKNQEHEQRCKDEIQQRFESQKSTIPVNRYVIERPFLHGKVRFDQSMFFHGDLFDRILIEIGLSEKEELLMRLFALYLNIQQQAKLTLQHVTQLNSISSISFSTSEIIQILDACPLVFKEKKAYCFFTPNCIAHFVWQEFFLFEKGNFTGKFMDKLPSPLVSSFALASAPSVFDPIRAEATKLKELKNQLISSQHYEEVAELRQQELHMYTSKMGEIWNNFMGR